jgi:hypothetical protein
LKLSVLLTLINRLINKIGMDEKELLQGSALTTEPTALPPGLTGASEVVGEEQSLFDKGLIDTG